ncbi:uncharacterized protein LOC129596427 [Paramacrobiotus metropolitanus]|uniref:uncharacterized protein LOC129596427 n=1 Tax=Paramacrobiotus metropolitanus TaxID=2943436 RepID=UPI0024460E28|nr:uncharacterized protein LOC129596427 [Paramacrobiotus metropolitanus]XP_055349677.1 uncharacterized protein LOC129596427 [Paramacrobiotus metropolitanus]
MDAFSFLNVEVKLPENVVKCYYVLDSSGAALKRVRRRGYLGDPVMPQSFVNREIPDSEFSPYCNDFVDTMRKARQMPRFRSRLMQEICGIMFMDATDDHVAVLAEKELSQTLTDSEVKQMYSNAKTLNINWNAANCRFDKEIGKTNSSDYYLADYESGEFRQMFGVEKVKEIKNNWQAIITAATDKKEKIDDHDVWWPENITQYQVVGEDKFGAEDLHHDFNLTISPGQEPNTGGSSHKDARFLRPTVGTRKSRSPSPLKKK